MRAQEKRPIELRYSLTHLRVLADSPHSFQHNLVRQAVFFRMQPFRVD